MIRTILLPTDGSDSSRPALEAALEWLKQVNGKLVVVSVAGTLSCNPLTEEAPSIDWKDYDEKQRQRARRVLDGVCAQATQAGVACEAVLAQSDDPAAAIVDASRTHPVDAIFMASHRHSRLTRLFVGSQTQKVLAHAGVPVMVFS